MDSVGGRGEVWVGGSDGGGGGGRLGAVVVGAVVHFDKRLGQGARAHISSI